VDVTLPKWGVSMQEATIEEWLVSLGDTVTEGQPIVRISTDKVETEVEAPGSGAVLEIVAPIDSVVAVGGVLAIIG